MIDMGIAAPLPYSGKKRTKKLKAEKGQVARLAVQRAAA
jgi:hypothetical protein